MEDPQRQRMAVMFTDVAGFSSLMESDESSAMKALDLIRQLLLPLLKRHDGRLVKEMGDGTLTVYSTPVAAVRVARALQRSLADRSFEVRIGVHFGDVLEGEDDVFGDTVNVASRIEGVSAPGGVCVSEELLAAYGRGRRPAVKDLGLRKLKGLGRLVRLYALKGRGGRIPVPVATRLQDTPRSASSKRPSLAVLPLENRGIESDTFYAYGISADLVGSLSKSGAVDVAPLSEISRLASAVGSDREAAGRVAADYLVTGTLWRRETVFHLSLELRKTESGDLVWSDSWSEDWFELPLIRGKLADSLLKALGLGGPVELTGGDSGVTEAYRHYLKGREKLRKMQSKSDLLDARSLLLNALGLDPDLLAARLLLADTYRRSGELDMAVRVCREATERAREKGNRAHLLQALNGTGISLWHRGELRRARSAFRRALKLAQGQGDREGQAKALNNLGLIHCEMGGYRRALELLERAGEIAEPLVCGSLKANILCNIGLAQMKLGDLQAALEFYRRSLDVYTAMEDLSGRLHIFANIAVVQNHMRCPEKALEMDVRALELAERLGDGRQTCRLLNNIGSIYIKHGLADQARKSFRKALEVARDGGDRILEGMCLYNLGLVSVNLREYSRAVGPASLSLEVARETGDAVGEHGALDMLAECRMELGNPEEAAELCREALRLARLAGHESAAASYRLMLALARSAEGIDEADARRELAETETLMNEQLHDEGPPSLYWRNARMLQNLLKMDFWSTSEAERIGRLLRSQLEAGDDSIEALTESVSDPEWRAALASLPEHMDLRRALRRAKEAGPRLERREPAED